MNAFVPLPRVWGLKITLTERAPPPPFSPLTLTTRWRGGKVKAFHFFDNGRVEKLKPSTFSNLGFSKSTSPPCNFNFLVSGNCAPTPILTFFGQKPTFFLTFKLFFKLSSCRLTPVLTFWKIAKLKKLAFNFFPFFKPKSYRLPSYSTFFNFGGHILTRNSIFSAPLKQKLRAFAFFDLWEWGGVPNRLASPRTNHTWARFRGLVCSSPPCSVVVGGLSWLFFKGFQSCGHTRPWPTRVSVSHVNPKLHFAFRGRGGGCHECF